MYRSRTQIYINIHLILWFRYVTHTHTSLSIYIYIEYPSCKSHILLQLGKSLLEPKWLQSSEKPQEASERGGGVELLAVEIAPKVVKN